MHEWIVLPIFILIYIFISIQRFPFIKIDRPAGVFTGVTLLILARVITLREGYSFIDWNVITFLLGMMIMLGYLQMSGFFQLAADLIVKVCRTPHALLLGVILVSGVLSAFFVNDTVCLLITPIVLASVAALKINPIPYLAAIAASSNVGSAMTITGNPQNMYIGVKTGIAFLKFSSMTIIPVIICLGIIYLVIRIVYGKSLKEFSGGGRSETLPRYDKALMIKCLTSLVITVILFVKGVDYPFAALIGATITILSARIKPDLAFKNVDWPILLFFAGLFVVMGAFEKVGYMDSLLGYVHGLMGHDSIFSIGIFAGFTVLVANAISNLPAVILMMPVIEGFEGDSGTVLLSLIATFAGNLTLVGSVANLIVAERASSSGVAFTFAEHFKTGLPITVLTCSVAVVWVYILTLL